MSGNAETLAGLTAARLSRFGIHVEPRNCADPAAAGILVQIDIAIVIASTWGDGQPPIDARISRISPFLSPGAFSGEVEIDVPNDGRLVPGMFVTVDVHYGESGTVTLVPSSALYEHPGTGESGVYIVAEQPDGVEEPGAPGDVVA